MCGRHCYHVFVDDTKMTTDRELLELAAKAAAIEYDPSRSKPHPVSGAFWGLSFANSARIRPSGWFDTYALIAMLSVVVFPVLCVHVDRWAR